MNMKQVMHRATAALCLALLLLCLSGCGSFYQSTAVQEAEPVSESSPAENPAASEETGLAAEPAAEAEPSPALTPEPSPEPSPEPTPDLRSPGERAAALGLPEPPVVDIESWEFRLMNSFNSCGWYTPETDYVESQRMDNRIIGQVQALINDARTAGLNAYIARGERNLDYTLNTWINFFAEHQHDALETARLRLPLGGDEHQSGLALDLSDQLIHNATYYDFDDPEIFSSDLAAWVREHCAEYGFILRYPADKADYYGYACPHLHLRYVGTEAAAYIMANDLCLEEFLMLYDPGAVYIPPDEANVFKMG